MTMMIGKYEGKQVLQTLDILDSKRKHITHLLINIHFLDLSKSNKTLRFIVFHTSGETTGISNVHDIYFLHIPKVM
jgi:hypothetical protein